VQREGGPRDAEAAAARVRSSTIRGLDGIRAVAALSVLVFHVWSYADPVAGPPTFPGSGPLLRLLPAGVTLFFALSGFLLYRPWAAALLDDGPLPDPWRYARHRAARILPAYWVVLLAATVVLPAGLLRLDVRPFELGRLTEDPALLLANLAMVQNYAPGTVYTGIGPAWSLVVEVAFYVSLPLLAAAALAMGRRLDPGRTSRHARLLVALLPPTLLAVLGLATKVAALLARPALGRWNEVVLVSPPYHADLFAAGMLAAVLLHLGMVPRRSREPVLGAGAATAVGLVAAEAGLLPQAGFETVVAASTAVVVWCVAAPAGAGRLTRVLSWRPLVGIGLASYSLYLWHEPVVHLAATRGLTVGGPAGRVADVVLLGGVSLALAGLTYRLVERPAAALRTRGTVPRTPQTPPVAPVQPPRPVPEPPEPSA
jgi:peptidoglycan/LPS O-acetylase OafA/YrhL